jgi:hypothetical protein
MRAARAAGDYDDLVRTLIERVDDGIRHAVTRNEHIRWTAVRLLVVELSAGTCEEKP